MMKKPNSAFSCRLRTGGHVSSLAAAVSSLPLMTANAAIVYSGLQNLVSGVGSNVAANVDQTADPEFSLQTTRGKAQASPGGWTRSSFQPSFYYVPPVCVTARYVNLISSGGLDFLITTPPAGANPAVALLGTDASIGGGGFFSAPNQTQFRLSTQFDSPYAGRSSGWLPGTEGVIGFRFNPSGDQFLYGWARLRINAFTSATTLVDWAYDNTGALVSAGQMPVSVPEPGTAFFLGAAGLAGAGFRRRRREHTWTISNA